MSVLMVSPTPTHPQDGGNRARIFRLAEELRSLGGDPFFLYYAMEPADLEAMRAYWGERLEVVPRRSRSFGLRARWDSFRYGIGVRLGELGAGGALPPPRPLDTDAWCPAELGMAALRLHAAHRFRVVWIEYVFLSRVLGGFGPSVLKAIDTMDVFSDRYEMMRAREMDPEWYYTTRESEKKGLARADWVVAIHGQDAAAFRAMGLARVATIGHFPAVRPSPDSPSRGRILFVASDNSGNVKAWSRFVETMLGPIKERLPDTSIRVAGKICRRIPEDPRYEKMGMVQDLGALYGSSTLAVNPEVRGTGLKIKTLEALAHGCPVVATPAGIRGIEEVEGCGILVGRTPADFLDGIVRLTTRPAFRAEQSRSALDFVGRYLHRNRQGLAELLGRAGLSGPRGALDDDA